MRSIRRRLLVLLLGLFIFGWLAALAGTWHTTALQLSRTFDADLIDFARVLLGVLDTRDEDSAQNARELISAINQRAPREIEPPAYRVWLHGHELVAAPDTPELPLPDGDGFALVQADGEVWHTFSVNDEDSGLLLQVIEPDSVRRQLVFELASSALAPLALALPLLGLLIWLGIGRGLQPLHALARQVAQRSPERLEALPTRNVPEEVGGLVTELNQLLARLQGALLAERRLTADAAHEIRTPLAGLKTHVQVARRSPDPEVHGRALAQVERSVDRITGLMEQILLLARLDASTAEAGFERIELHRLATEIVAELAPRALEQQLDIALEGHAACVQGNRHGLQLLIGNLVRNAIRYTPAGGSIEVRVEQHGDSVRLCVADNGPGIPPDEREHVFERFYRGRDVQAPGNGLGLAIVARIAELHGARLSIDDGLGGVGTRVCVELAVAPAR